MNARGRGFGMIEMLLALTLGLVLVMGLVQISLGARITHANQNASALLQDDARFILGKMIQEIRLAGMFGCQSVASIGNAPADFARPIGWSAAGGVKTLTLVTADAGGNRSKADWTVLSDCVNAAQAYAGAAPGPAPGQIHFPIRKLTYVFDGGNCASAPPRLRPGQGWWITCVRSMSVSGWREGGLKRRGTL